jgi:hypothetical protein
VFAGFAGWGGAAWLQSARCRPNTPAYAPQPGQSVRVIASLARPWSRRLGIGHAAASLLRGLGGAISWPAMTPVGRWRRGNPSSHALEGPWAHGVVTSAPPR